MLLLLCGSTLVVEYEGGDGAGSGWGARSLDSTVMVTLDGWGILKSKAFTFCGGSLRVALTGVVDPRR